MNRRLPPIPVLKSFEAVARLSSFTKAAEELCVTRSAVSHRIQILEEIIDSYVFERGSKPLTLTSTGAACLSSVRKVLYALDDISEIAEESSFSEKISMNMPPTFARMVALNKIKEFIERKNGIEVSIEISMSQIDYKAGVNDIDIRYGRGNYVGMESQVISNDFIYPVATPNYIEKLKLKSPEDLKNAELLRSRLEPWRNWFRSASLDWEEPKHGHRFEDLSLLYSAASHDLGVALARSSLVKPFIESGELVPVFDIKSYSQYSYYIVYKKSVLKRDGVAELIELIKNSQ